MGNVLGLKYNINRIISGRSRIYLDGGGANFQGGDANLLFGQIFTENCMKMKEFGPGGQCVSLAPPLDLLMELLIPFFIATFFFRFLKTKSLCLKR